MLLLFALLALFFLFVRNARLKKAALLSLLPIFSLSCTSNTGSDYSPDVKSSVSNSNGEWEYIVPTGLRRNFYGSAGVGGSTLNPDLSELADQEVEHSVNPSGQLSLGFDLSKHASFELHAASLDEAEISPTGSIGYSQIGGSALLYIGNARNKYRRQGLSAFARIGLGTFLNSSTPDVPQRMRHNQHVLFGLGADYMLGNGFGLRTEVISFDEDAQLAQLALVYRFGSKDRRRIPPALAQALPDIDDDGIEDIQDDCDYTKPNLSVNRDGCAHFDGIVEGVEFEFDKSDLTINAQYVLDSVIQTLLEYPEANLNIAAHTDSIASDEYNIALSIRRARSVAAYLVNGGVAVPRLRARGYGESQPIETNATSEGRARNRRVEMQSVLY